MLPRTACCIVPWNDKNAREETAVMRRWLSAFVLLALAAPLPRVGGVLVLPVGGEVDVVGGACVEEVDVG